MRLLGQFKTSLVFLRKNFARTKTQIKPKPTNFLCLRSFYAQKIVAFVVFSSLNFISLVGFGLIWVFVRAKSFPKVQKKNWFEIVLITYVLYYWHVPLSTHLSRVCLYALIFICGHLWESLLFMRILLNPSYLWESLLIYDRL